VRAEWSVTIPGMKNWGWGQNQAVPTRENGKYCKVVELRWDMEEPWDAACFPSYFQRICGLIPAKQSEQWYLPLHLSLPQIQQTS